jgi:hypothetical protein
METKHVNAGLEDFPWRSRFMPRFEEMLRRLCALPDIPLEPVGSGKNRRLALIERTFPGDYEETDSLTDWEAEPARVQCKEKNYPSPADAWCIVRQKKQLPMNDRLRREYVYEVARGCNLFNIAFGIYLLRGYGDWAGAAGPGDVLDPCAGWGDRLGAAFVAGARSYKGWDTNPSLQDVYSALAARYERGGLALDWKVECAPFEGAAVETLSAGFDTVLTSPPFYDKELYDGLATSTKMYRNIDEWYDKFYCVMWGKAAAALRAGGRVIAYIPPGRMFGEANRVLTGAGLKYIGKVGFLQVTDSMPANREKCIRDAYIWCR